VVAAFATDPLLRWVWAAQDRYLACAPNFFGMLLDVRLEGGEVWTADDAGAVAMWDPPGGLYLPVDDQRWEQVRSGFTEAERAAWAAYDASMAVPPDAGPHWYLGVLATAPDRWRTGLARAVMGPMLAAADRARVPAYLETANGGNLAVYGRFGFEPVREVDLPGGGPRCWLMRRDPQAAT
jgi:GNAT superfamily N-acetyltransferase